MGVWDIKKIFEDLTPRLKLYMFFMSLSVSFYLLFLIICFYAAGGILEREESRIFIWGWGSVPLLTLLVLFLMIKLERRFNVGPSLFYPLLLLTNGIFWCVAIWGMRLTSFAGTPMNTLSGLLAAWDTQIPSWQTGEWQANPISTGVLTMIAVGFPAVNFLAILGIKFILRHVKESQENQSKAAGLIHGMIPLMIGLAVLPFADFKSKDLPLLILLPIFLMGFPYFQSMPRLRFPAWLNRQGGVWAVIFITLLVFEPFFPIDRHHQNSFIEAITDFLGGKSLLVDINSQYGIFIIYFLSFIFKFLPLSYQGLTFCVNILTIGQYIALYFILKYLFKSGAFSFGAVSLMIVVNYFATLGYASFFPSIGPLRFGLPYLLILTALLRYKQRVPKFLNYSEYAVVGISSIWSFEGFMYTLATYAGLVGYETYVRSVNQGGGHFLKEILKKFSLVITFCLAAHGFLALHIYLRAGQLPHWEYYFDYIILFLLKGHGAMPIALWTPWVFTVFIPLLSLILLVLTKINPENEDDRGRLSLMAGLTVLSIVQFTYFLGRSHPNNLFHISIPLIILSVFWMIRFQKACPRYPKEFYSAFISCCYFAIILLCIHLYPRVLEKIQGRLAEYPKIRGHWSLVLKPQPTNEMVAEALYLIDKYANESRRIAIFLDPDETTETLMLSRKVHIYPFNYVSGSAASLTQARKRVADFAPQLKNGDIIYLARNLSNWQLSVLLKLRQKFEFIEKERTPHGVSAVELRNSLP